ncbi:MAG: hypothetical protein ACREQ5_03495 [Candidatus Dormibacteria bacterium]
MSNNFRYFRLINSDNVIAEIAGTPTGGKIRLFRPLQVFVERIEGHIELIIYPWIPISSCDAKYVDINESHLMFQVPLLDNASIMMSGYAKKLYDEPNALAGDFKEFVGNKGPVQDSLQELLLKLDKDKKPN